MATVELFASCSPTRKQTVAPQQRIGKAIVSALERMPAWRLCALLLIALFPGLVPAQDTFSSSAAPTTYSDPYATSCEQGAPPNVFKQVGMNPLTCYGQMEPADSQKKCSLARMQVLKQVGTMCYYCAPIVPPTNGIIVPFDQISQATSQGFSCGSDQVDPSCMAICSKSGSLKYTPPSISGNIPSANPPSGGIPTLTPATEAPPPPAKDLTRVGPLRIPQTQIELKPPGPAPAVPTYTAIYQKMNDCLRAKVLYMIVFLPQNPYMTQALIAAEGSVAPSTPIAQVPFRSQLFILETAAALQAQAYHDRVYGPSTVVPNAEDQKDNIVGWFDRCLADAGIAPEAEDLGPQNPGVAYAAFLGAGSTPDRRRVFGDGYKNPMLTPLSLLPPWTGPSASSAPATTTPNPPAPTAPPAPLAH